MVLQHTEALTRSLKTEYDAVFYSLQYRAVSEYQLPQTFFLKFLYNNRSVSKEKSRMSGVGFQSSEDGRNGIKGDRKREKIS